jgi:undecaprenyl-diphosphatase
MAVTTVGGLVGMGVTTAAVAVALWRRSRLQAVFVVSCYVAALMMVGALKLGFGRERPLLVEPLAVETTPSFPSGHATVSIAVAGALSFLFAWRQRSLWMRAGVIGTAVIVVLAIGFSRLYLGVHYLSDVLAGWLAGGAIVALAAGTLAAIEHRRARSTRS